MSVNHRSRCHAESENRMLTSGSSSGEPVGSSHGACVCMCLLEGTTYAKGGKSGSCLKTGSNVPQLLHGTEEEAFRNSSENKSTQTAKSVFFVGRGTSKVC